MSNYQKKKKKLQKRSNENAQRKRSHEVMLFVWITLQISFFPTVVTLTQENLTEHVSNQTIYIFCTFIAHE